MATKRAISTATGLAGNEEGDGEGGKGNGKGNDVTSKERGNGKGGKGNSNGKKDGRQQRGQWQEASATYHTIASCHASPGPLVWLVVALPLLILPPFHLPVSLPLIAPSPLVPPLLGLSSGWLLRCLSSCHHIPSAGASISHRAVASCHTLSLSHCLSHL
jgi:hypothetical protein